MKLLYYMCNAEYAQALFSAHYAERRLKHQIAVEKLKDTLRHMGSVL